MSFLPLTLGVGQTFNAGGGSLKAPSKSDIESTFKRDDFTCRFCGFRAVQYQKLVPTKDGLVTACGFCEQVLALDHASVTGGGVLLWLPEITQVELNHVARAIYVARMDEKNPMYDVASRSLDALMARRTEARKRLGSEDPLLLATILHENLNDKEREAAVQKLDGIRLMPPDKHMVRTKSGDINGFPQILRFWCSPQGPFGQMPTDEWRELFLKVAA